MKPVKIVLFIVPFVAGPFTSCKKEETPEIIIEITSLTQTPDQIHYVFNVDVVDHDFRISEKGMIFGTSPDLGTQGTKIMHGDSYGVSESSVYAVSNTTYYFQVYAIIDDEEYLGDVLSTTTGPGWTKLTSAPALPCSNMAVSPNGTVHAVGLNGTHFYSTDEGATWNQVTHINNEPLSEIKFIDDNVALMQAGWEMRKSVDGGMTWTDIVLPGPSSNFVFFYDANTFFASRADSIYRTTDGGSNWFAAYVPKTTGWGTPEAMYFLSPLIGYAVSFHGNVTKTIDGGVTWNLVTSTTMPQGTKDLWFIDESTGVAVQMYDLYVTQDGGETWTQKINGIKLLYQVHFCNDDIGVVCGADGTLMRTTDGGSVWLGEGYPDTDENIHDVKLVNTGLGYAIDADGAILKYD